MSWHFRPLTLAVLWATLGTQGCATPTTASRAERQALQRIVALEKLNAFVGRWEVTGEARPVGLGRTVPFHGVNEVRPGGDGAFIVAQGETRSEGREPAQGMAIWTYDARGGRYRGVSISENGDAAMSTGWYDESTKTWHLRSNSRGSAGRMWWVGEVRFDNENTKTERWRGYRLGGFVKKVEISKTEHRCVGPGRSSDMDYIPPMETGSASRP